VSLGLAEHNSPDHTDLIREVLVLITVWPLCLDDLITYSQDDYNAFPESFVRSVWPKRLAAQVFPPVIPHKAQGSAASPLPNGRRAV